MYRIAVQVQKCKKNLKNNCGNIFKNFFENRRIALRVKNLATESFKFIFYQWLDQFILSIIFKELFSIRFYPVNYLVKIDQLIAPMIGGPWWKLKCNFDDRGFYCLYLIQQVFITGLNSVIFQARTFKLWRVIK